MARQLRTVFAAHAAFFCYVISTCMVTAHEGVFFTSIPQFESGSDQTDTTYVSAFSAVQCASLCSKAPACLSFNYDEKTQTCQISDVVITNSNGVVFSVDKECPASKGYKLYKLQEIMLCIKIIATDVRQWTAKDDCEYDDGHLLVIENEAMHLFVKTIVTAAGTVWVDGRDLYSNNTMFSWNGKQVPYIAWAHDEPDNGSQNCLIISSVRGFNFRDGACDSGNVEHGYLCQID